MLSFPARGTPYQRGRCEAAAGELCTFVLDRERVAEDVECRCRARVCDQRRPRVVGGEGEVEPSEAGQQLSQIVGAGDRVCRGIGAVDVQRGGRFRHQLKHSLCAGAGERGGVEIRLDLDQRDKKRRRQPGGSSGTGQDRSRRRGHRAAESTWLTGRHYGREAMRLSLQMLPGRSRPLELGDHDRQRHQGEAQRPGDRNRERQPAPRTLPPAQRASTCTTLKHSKRWFHLSSTRTGAASLRTATNAIVRERSG